MCRVSLILEGSKEDSLRISVSLIFSNCEFEELRPYKTTDLVRKHGKSVVELFSTPPARARGGCVKFTSKGNLKKKFEDLKVPSK